MEFLMPPVLHNQKGSLRTAGFELEFGAVNLDTAAACIMELFGGTQQRESAFRQQVTGTRLGDFSLEMDARYFSEKQYEALFEKAGLDPAEIKLGAHTLEQQLEKALEAVASYLVPYEISCPPVRFSELPELEKLRLALLARKATGTTASVINAFATHINPELPRLDAATLLRYTRAFLLLYPWLVKDLDVNITRRLSSFIKPFPPDYIRLVLPAAYAPDLPTFIEDYHRYNPDRNRPLDLYPVLACAAPDALAAFPEIGKLNPRPTLHFRLPNSLIDDPSWSLAKVWNSWVAVEKLAADPDCLTTLSVDYLEKEAATLVGFEGKWCKRLQTWLESDGT